MFSVKNILGYFHPIFSVLSTQDLRSLRVFIIRLELFCHSTVLHMVLPETPWPIDTCIYVL